VVYPLADQVMTKVRGRQKLEVRPIKTVRAPDGRLAVADRIIVGFQPGISQIDIASAHRAAQAHGMRAAAVRSLGTSAQLVDISGASFEQGLQVYRSDPRVKYAEPDYINRYDDIPNDPMFGGQWGLTQAQLPNAWTITHGSPARFIAILDSGIYDEISTFPAPDGGAGHPDLRGKVSANVNFSSEPDADDFADHGTDVAGVASAATNNSLGIAGAGWQTQLMNVKVGDMNGVTDSGAIAGLHWAADNGASVANMSFGATGPCTAAWQDAVNYAWARGVVVVASAGNDGTPNVGTPASCQHVLSVASVTNSDTRSSFSTFGTWVQLAAAGGTGDTTGPNIVTTDFVGSYSTVAGTSFSAPLVSGVAALTWTTSFGTSNQAVVDRLEETADHIAGTGSLWQFGRVNAFQAVSQPTCSSAPVSITVGPATPGTLSVTIAASGFDVFLKDVQFSNPGSNPVQPVNALVDIGSVTGQSGAFNYTPVLGTRSQTFNVRRAGPGATTVPMIVTSSCGQWQSFVGGGASAF
jgi:thermitase